MNAYNTKINNKQILALGGSDNLSQEGKEVLVKRVRQARNEAKKWREMADKATNPIIRENYLLLAEQAESAL